MTEDPIDLLTNAQEEQNALLKQIVAQLKKGPEFSRLEDAIDDQTDVLRELVKLESKPDSPEPAPVFNVNVPQVELPAPVVNVSPGQTVVVENRAKRYFSTVKRDSNGYIESIETVVIE